MSPNLQPEAHALIQNILYLTLATSDKHGKPWCTPVNTAYDEHYNFYWASAVETRHSQNIKQNPAVGATIYNSALPEGTGNAVYMEGTASELTPQTWQTALTLLRERSQNPDLYYPHDYYAKLQDVRIYQFTPQTVYMLKPGGTTAYGTYAACRIEITL